MSNSFSLAMIPRTRWYASLWLPSVGGRAALAANCLLEQVAQVGPLLVVELGDAVELA